MFANFRIKRSDPRHRILCFEEIDESILKYSLPQVEALDLTKSLYGCFIRQQGFCEITRDYVGTQARQFYL